jgi:hypothetical protein
LSDGDPIAFPVRCTGPYDHFSPAAGDAGSLPSAVAFNRQELAAILDLYGRKVASGAWRDYAIDMLRDKAVFSVFRKATEFPLYSIEKSPKLAKRQGAYSVIAAGGLILKRGHDLRRVLGVLEAKPELVR